MIPAMIGGIAVLVVACCLAWAAGRLLALNSPTQRQGGSSPRVSPVPGRGLPHAPGNLTSTKETIMKTLILAGALAVASLPANAAEYGTKATLDAMGCTGAGIAAAFSGDFSNWVLPDFIPGKHLRAGQYIEAVTGADGVRRCVVKGAPG